MRESLDLGYLMPGKWYVVFHRRATTWWVNWLALGRYKHVSAFGYAEVAGVWVILDYHLRRTKLVVVPDRLYDVVLPGHILDSDVIAMEPRSEAWPAIGCCASSVAHLIGLRGCALRPDALFRHCLANGGILLGGVTDENGGQGAADADRDGEARADETVEAGNRAA